MIASISGYESVFDNIFKGKDYVLYDIPGGVSFDIKVKARCEEKDYIVKIIEGNAPNPGNPEKRMMWYQALAKVREENSNLLSPFLFEVHNDHVVTVTEWIHGKQLNEVFRLHPERMVSIGKTVGKILRNIHNQEFVRDILKARNVSVAPAVNTLAEKLTEEIRSRGITFSGIDRAIKYLNDNLSLISEDRAGIVHNDIRPENFILTDDSIYIYDFDSGMIMDCYADFAYLTIMSEKDFRPFSYGVIMSYFDTEIPVEFWKVNLVFGILKLLDYAIYKFNKKGTMVVQQAASFIEAFEDYTTAVPTWWKTLNEKYEGEYLSLGE